MRRVLIVLVVMALITFPARAQEVATSAHADLTETPMECMMPALPSLLMSHAGSPIDSFKSGMTNVSDYAQDVAIYLNCAGNKMWVEANDFCQSAIDIARVKWKQMQEKKNSAN
jgi:hypothetical protein